MAFWHPVFRLGDPASSPLPCLSPLLLRNFSLEVCEGSREWREVLHPPGCARSRARSRATTGNDSLRISSASARRAFASATGPVHVSAVECKKTVMPPGCGENANDTRSSREPSPVRAREQQRGRAADKIVEKMLFSHPNRARFSRRPGVVGVLSTTRWHYRFLALGG